MASAAGTIAKHMRNVSNDHQPNFAPWPRCRLIRGTVPGTLDEFPKDRRVAYFSIDMNIVLPEIAAIEFFWDRLVPGAVVLLDDYGWATHLAQKEAFDAFAQAHNAMILTLPTGQGHHALIGSPIG